MGTYLRPVANATIEDSWQGHKNRNPPSAEPGTDYGCAYGSNVLAATNGVITYVDTNPDGADGRVVGLAADDGNYIRYLHLSQALVSVNQRVTRGQAIAKSGGSGNNRDDHYAPHVHVSLWIGGTPSSQGYANTVDFENYIGNETPAPGGNQEEDMTMLYAAAVTGGTKIILANGGLFWQVDVNATNEFTATGGKVVWLAQATLNSLVTDARASKTKDAAPILLKFPSASKVAYCAHGGAVLLAQPTGEEYNNLRAAGVKAIKVSEAVGTLIINNLRAGTAA